MRIHTPWPITACTRRLRAALSPPAELGEASGEILEPPVCEGIPYRPAFLGVRAGAYMRGLAARTGAGPFRGGRSSVPQGARPS